MPGVLSATHGLGADGSSVVAVPRIAQQCYRNRPVVRGAYTQVFQHLPESGLQLKPSKCSFFKSEVQYLGHIISCDGVATDPEKTAKVATWPVPASKEEVQQFANYYRCYMNHESRVQGKCITIPTRTTSFSKEKGAALGGTRTHDTLLSRQSALPTELPGQLSKQGSKSIKDFAQHARPLHCLTEQTSQFQWTDACHEAFGELCKRLCSAPVLAYPNFEKLFILDTDASDVGIGGVLSQLHGEEKERVIAYGSRLLSKPEQRYCVTRRELLAVVTFIHLYRP